MQVTASCAEISLSAPSAERKCTALSRSSPRKAIGRQVEVKVNRNRGCYGIRRERSYAASRRQGHFQPARLPNPARWDVLACKVPSSASSCCVNFASAAPRRPTMWMASIGCVSSHDVTSDERSEPANSVAPLARTRATSIATFPLPMITADRTPWTTGGPVVRMAVVPAGECG